jgi:hypothetical protein
MRRKDLPQVRKLRAIQTDLVENHVHIDHRHSRLQRRVVRMQQCSCTGVRGVKSALDYQCGHAAGDAEGDEFVAWEAVDEEERKAAAAEGKRDPPTLVEEGRVGIEAEAGVQGRAVVVCIYESAGNRLLFAGG